MNLVRDSEGSIIYGVVEPNVYYSRFMGKLSARLGATHLNDLQQVLEGGSAVSFFADSSELTSYDLLARSAFVRLLLSHRKRFAEVLILNWAGGATATAQALASTVGEPVEMLEDRHEFERRLTSIAPRALQIIRGSLAPHSGLVAADGPSAALRVTRG